MRVPQEQYELQPQPLTEKKKVRCYKENIKRDDDRNVEIEQIRRNEDVVTSIEHSGSGNLDCIVETSVTDTDKGPNVNNDYNFHSHNVRINSYDRTDVYMPPSTYDQHIPMHINVQSTASPPRIETIYTIPTIPPLPPRVHTTYNNPSNPIYHTNSNVHKMNPNVQSGYVPPSYPTHIDTANLNNNEPRPPLGVIPKLEVNSGGQEHIKTHEVQTNSHKQESFNHHEKNEERIINPSTSYTVHHDWSYGDSSYHPGFNHEGSANQYDPRFRSYSRSASEKNINKDIVFVLFLELVILHFI